ncbi:hypothetical protein Hanom_Chr04g00374201 [Helianthus anomalus]
MHTSPTKERESDEIVYVSLIAIQVYDRNSDLKANLSALRLINQNHEVPTLFCKKVAYVLKRK